MPKIKILFTIPNFKTAGSQYVLLSLYRGIDKTVFDPYVCVEKFPEAIPSVIPENRRFVFEFEGKIKKDVLRFRKFLKENNIDLLHSWDYKSNYIEPLACKFSGVKYLYTKKNNAWSNRWKLKSLLSNHIAYDNPEMKNRFFNSFLFRTKISFIPHGVNTKVFKPLPKKTHSAFSIGCIGNIGSNKNQLFIVKALQSLPENVVLHVYGNEEVAYRALLDDYIHKNKLEDRVKFHGFVKNAKLPEVLSKLDLFVLASIQEGLPVSILEALACGVPVLSSDSGGGARYLLKSDAIFSLQNTDELVEKILMIYNSTLGEKQKAADDAIEKIRTDFTLEREVSAYENLYKKIIGIT